jgi:KUP system potassium uptake protein
VVLATLATIIASQAVITGTFSLVSQAITLHTCPRLSVYHSSTKMAGQIYVPFFNYLVRNRVLSKPAAHFLFLFR